MAKGKKNRRRSCTSCSLGDTTNPIPSLSLYDPSLYQSAQSARKHSKAKPGHCSSAKVADPANGCSEPGPAKSTPSISPGPTPAQTAQELRCAWNRIIMRGTSYD